MSVLLHIGISAAIALASVIGVTLLPISLEWLSYLFIGVAIWFLVLILAITPATMWKGKAQQLRKLTAKQLVVSMAEPHEPGDGSHWLRLRVTNPSALPIRDCYGKLVRYTALIQGKPVTELEPRGIADKLNEGLPPAGHLFPWLPTNLPPVATTISGHGGQAFLYVAVSRDQDFRFYTPTEMNLRYGKVDPGTFEIMIEIGSEEGEFRPARVRFEFSHEGFQLKSTKLETIDSDETFK